MKESSTVPDRSFIGGKWFTGTGTQTIALNSAFDDSVVLPTLHCADTKDADAAVDSAEAALQEWKTAPDSKKRDLFFSYAALICDHAEELGRLEAIVVGKPAHLALYEAYIAADVFRYFAGYIGKLGGTCFTADEEGFFRYVRHEPYGLCAAINPFNSPMTAFAMKAAPALATGNVIVSKCSEFNPFSSLRLAELAVEAGIPAGVLNVIVGTLEAGAALSSHMKIRKISFTGSTAVGRQIQADATNSNFKRVTLELGGKSPFIIFEDADLEAAIADSFQNITALNGQGCILGTRVFVQEGAADKYLKAMKEKFEALALTLGGDPMSKATVSSPLAHAGQLKRVLSFLDKGQSEAELITGGSRHGDTGCYVKPTIFFQPKEGADISTKEIFGPVLCVATFKDESTIAAKANDTEFGLGAYLYTKDLDRVFRLTGQLEAGTVMVNNASIMDNNLPYGGFKSSGIGRENGMAVLRNYTQEKAVILAYKNTVL
ncbi:hypothetical protein N7490_008265 [Penicillium lividum]|nr:hypothetical protein N7490_008265 [Penicillium lividum]